MSPTVSSQPFSLRTSSARRSARSSSGTARGGRCSSVTMRLSAENSPDFAFARAAFELCRQWYDGERFDPDRFEEAYADENGGGVLRGAINARSPLELAAWGVLAGAIM